MRPVREPQHGELLVSVTATGLCGSDLHYYTHGRNGAFVVQHPFCLGHESIGTVLALGPQDELGGGGDGDGDGGDDSSRNDRGGKVRVGDRVALEVGFPCAKCASCRLGRYNICPTLRFRSSAKTNPHLDGTLMGITTHPVRLAHRLPPQMTDREGALLEPLAVCMHAINRSRRVSEAEVQLRREVGGQQAESAALVFGAGAMGLLLASALAASQPFTKIVVADIAADRLAVARQLPFGDRIDTCELSRSGPLSTAADDSSSGAEAEDDAARATADELCRRFSVPNGFLRTHDCTGAPSCIRAAIHATQPGGTVTLVGMGGPRCPPVPLPAAAVKEVDIIGVFRYDGACYPAAIELMASGAMRGVADCIVTHTVALEEGVKAFQLAGKGVDEAGRPVVKVVVMNDRDSKL
ncbi:hypothetical protein KEM52_003080 [Ascosphaera acerosa]|nr:hypothetical protein KEM52_003080 [Ascosphaera acerosa]